MDNRVDQLERSVRRLQIQLRVCLGIAAVAVAGAMLGFVDSKSTEPGVIRATCLVIERDGKPIGVLGPDEDGASLLLERDKVQVRVSSASSHPGMAAVDLASQSAAFMGTANESAAVVIRGRAETPGIILSSDKDSNQLSLFRPSSKGLLELTAKDSGVAISLFDAAGTRRGTLSALDKFGATFATFTENGEISKIVP